MRESIDDSSSVRDGRGAFLQRKFGNETNSGSQVWHIERGREGGSVIICFDLLLASFSFLLASTRTDTQPENA